MVHRTRLIRLRYLLAVAAITLLAAALRLYKLGDANIWEDEAITAWFAHLSVGQMALSTAGDTHPPLSYLLFHLWEQGAGASAYGLRFLAAAFGILTVPATAAVAGRLNGPTAGIIAGFLLAVSRFHVWWSEQIRMYSLAALFTAISIYCFLAAVDCWKSRPGRSRLLLAAMAAVNLAGLYSLYFYVLLILLESLLVLALLLRRFSATLFVWWTWLHVASILLFLPWLAYFRQHSITFPTRGAARLTTWQFVEGSWSELMLGIDTHVERLRPLNAILAALAVGLLIWLLVRQRRSIAGWLALLVVALPVTAYLITLPTGLFFSPTYQTRYQLMAVPALAVLLGWGISSLPKWGRAVPLLGLAAVGAVTLAALYAGRHLVDDYQSLARFVQAYERPGDLIVFDPDSDFDLFLFQYQGHLPWTGLPVNQRLDRATTERYFTAWTKASSAIWLIQVAGGHDAGSDHPVRSWLDSHLQATLQRTVGNKLAVLYEPHGAPARKLAAAFSPDHILSGVPGVRGYDLPIVDVRPGDLVNLSAYGTGVAGAKVKLAGYAFGGQPFPDQVAFSLPINPSIRAGKQQLILQLPGGRQVGLAAISVEPHTIPSSAPAALLAHSVNRDFGGNALLTSYDLDPATPRPGQTLTVTLQWEAERPFAQDYTVFVHLLDSSNHVIAQQDSQPQGGRSPTVKWVPGQTIEDAYELSMPPALPPGTYTIEAGMYLQSTGERLRLADAAGGDHVLLGQIKIGAEN